MKAALLGVSVAALASGVSLAAAKPARAAVAAPVGKLEPEALSARRRRSAYLNTLPRFQVSLQTERDDVDDEGELLTMAGETTFKVNKPDGFHISDTESATTREFIYNGKQLTIADPKSGLYAQVPAPPTIRETLDVAADKYDIVVPLEDLFNWGGAQGLLHGRRSAGHTLNRPNAGFPASCAQ